jgi:hypothetical protein
MKRIMIGCAVAVSTLAFGVVGVAHANSPSNGQSPCSQWPSSPSAPSANSRQPDGFVDFSNPPASLIATVQTPGELVSFLAGQGVHGVTAGGVVASVCRP